MVTSFKWVGLDGIRFSFVTDSRHSRSALLLAVVLYWVARCHGSWVSLGLFCLFRVTHR